MRAHIRSDSIERGFSPRHIALDMIISGSVSQSLASRLATELDRPLAVVEYDRFPDGELYVKIDDAVSEEVVIVGSTITSDAHIELLQLQDAAREAGAEKITTVIPYMGYGRQDKAFKSGESVSARAMANAISVETDQVFVVTPHEKATCEFFTPTAVSVDGAKQLAEPLPDDLLDPVILAPDAGATDLAEAVRNEYGTGTVKSFDKIRHSGNEVEISGDEINVDGRDIVIVDDIIATGTTMSEAIETLQTDGARNVFVTCVHPLLAQNARLKLSKAGATEIYATDTIEQPESAVSVAPVLAEKLA